LRFANRSSSSAVRLLAVLALAGATLALALVTDEPLAVLVGLGVAAPAAVLLVLDVTRTERRRHQQAERQLVDEAGMLESLVSSLGTIAATLEPDAIAEVTRSEAEHLFDARAELLDSGGAGEEAAGEVLVPLRLGDEARLLRLVPRRPLTRADVARALVLGDFATRVHENARLRVEAEEREAERARLSDELVTAEQGERRRLALFLHDTSVQALSGMALMLDAGLQSLSAGRVDEARTVVGSALERLREAIRALRELSFALEPVVLRDQGFGAAVQALTDQLTLDGRIAFEIDVAAADGLDERAQAALYQIFREALHGAIRRGPPAHVSLRVAELEGGGYEAVIADDAPGERRRASFEPIVERARAVSGRVAVQPGHGTGTTVRVRLPAYAARG
jgi:signal transduction histidine kinase